MNGINGQPKHKPGGIAEMVAIAFPMVISFSCDTAMTFMDRLFLSRLGPEHMNAAMGGGISSFLLMSFFLGLVGYVTALAAQYLGAGQKSRCSKVLTQAWIIILLAYPLLLLSRPLAHSFFAGTGISAGQLVLQREYFDILVVGTIFSLGRHALSSFFSGIGRTTVVMGSSLLAMGVNLAVSYCLIFGVFGFPALGIKGAAMGTLAGMASGCLMLFAFYLEKKNADDFAVLRSFSFDREVMGKLLRFGYPAGIEFALNILAFSGMVFLFHAQGPVAATAVTIVFNWDMVTFVPLLGIEIGVTSLVGRYVGAQRFDIVGRSVKSGLNMGFAYAALMLFLFVVFPVELVGFFRPDHADAVFAEAVPLAVAMVRLVVLYVLAEAVLIVYIGALRGAGDTFWAMVVSVSIHWALLLLLYVLLEHFDVSTFHAWAAIVGTFAVLSVLPYVRYKQGRWRDIHVVDPA